VNVTPLPVLSQFLLLCYLTLGFLLPGYKVITFKNPYLGNTCVPFQHWACSIDCAMALEIPARLEQIAAAQALDQGYEKYIETCQRHFSRPRARTPWSCVSQHSLDSEADSSSSITDSTASRPSSTSHRTASSLSSNKTASSLSSNKTASTSCNSCVVS
jgi:hypothetical protein